MPAADTGEMTSVSTKMPQPKPTNRAAQMVDDTDSEDGSEEGESLQFKVILVGDGAVGKTSLATRFCEDHFAKHYKQTIGVWLKLGLWSCFGR